jgi:Uma2 family endonuclease
MPPSSTEAARTVRPLRRAEYDQLIQLGAFAGEHIELLDGALVQMSPIGPPHRATVTRIRDLFAEALKGKAYVFSQGPFAAGDLSEPEPDISVAPLADYDHVHPDRAHLLIEVAESSLATDRGRKARLYAECGVPEYWVANIVARNVEVYTEPVSGIYQRVAVYEKGSRIRLQEFPELEVPVDDFMR